MNVKRQKLQKKKILPKFIIDNDCVHNITNITIPEDVNCLLSFGPKFAVPIENNQFPTFKIISEVEDILTNYQDKNKIPEDRNEITNSINNFIKTNNNHTYINKFLTRAYKSTNRFIKENQEIYITNSDKSNKTVIINKQEYNKKMREHLSDTSTYQYLPNDPTTKVNNIQKKLINQLVIKKYISMEQRQYLMNYNPITPRIYGLPKLHKTGIPLRPIVSTIGSPSYKLSKYLIQSLKPLSQNSNTNVKNSFEFKAQLNSITLKSEDVLCSFDVTALYTNIPINLALQEINNRWDEIENNTNLPKNEFMQLITFCAKDNNFFKFNKQIFKQIKGLAMGNPLSPVLADIVMQKLFTTCLDKIEVQPTLIKKYVDDIIIIAPQKIIDEIFNLFQNFHQNIKFTIEKETNKSIPFLDLLLIRNGSKIITDWFCKPTSSNRILNFLSAHPLKIKINIAKSLISKILTLSNENYHTKNIQIIKHILIKNNYPSNIINSLIFKFYNPDHIHNSQSHPNSNNTQVNPVTTYTYKSLTFCSQITNRIQKIVNKHNKHIKIASRVPKKMQQLFTNLKDKIEKEQNENIIYSIPCLDCDKSYIGHTQRALNIRLKEHIYSIKNPHITKHKTALVTHHIQTGHRYNFAETKIIDREQQYKRRIILESCHIWSNSEKTINFRSDLEKVNTYALVFNTIKNKNENL